MIDQKEFRLSLIKWQDDWNLFARDILKANLDTSQQRILSDIQKNSRVSVRSGTARGKDYLAAVASICFLYLIPFNPITGDFKAAKVVNTAPTGRQVKNIMIPEISKIHTGKGFEMFGSRLLNDGIRFTDEIFKDWFLTGFKASDSSIEAWSGLHAPNIMVVITEASGLSQTTFDAIEGILQGNSRLLILFNPNNQTGEAYKSTRSTLYVKHRLNDLDAPNVVNYQKYVDGLITLQEYQNNEIPGQVDWPWINEKIEKGWAKEIKESEIKDENYDFEWNHKFYRPNDLFRIKVLGEFAKESEDVLIPMSWIEAANKRWDHLDQKKMEDVANLNLGVDIAGMGRDNTVFCYRYDNYVSKLEQSAMSINKETVHMQSAGKIKNILDQNSKGKAMIDTIGEGAGVYSRLKEQNVEGAISAKVSFGVKGKKDITGIFEFADMRSYLYWAVRDALDPANDINLAIPHDEELAEELNVIKFWFNSNGKIQIMPKDKIKEEIKRSPDKSDALSLSYFPAPVVMMTDFSKLGNI